MCVLCMPCELCGNKTFHIQAFSVHLYRYTIRKAYTGYNVQYKKILQSKSWPCLSLHPLNPHIHIQPHIIVSERVCTHFLWENEYILSVLKRAHVVCVITSVGDWICVTAIVSIVVAVAAFAFSHCRIFAHFIFEFVSKICTELIHLCRLQLLSINSSVCRCNMLVDCVVIYNLQHTHGLWL